jgi:predicted membrane channel-forming protein YqfA (hemolysin III family)
MSLDQRNRTMGRICRSAPTEAAFPEHSPAERRADALVHAVGLVLGLAACVLLAATALPRARFWHLVSLGLYATGLMAMLGCSALYNLTTAGPRKALFRRLDHAAIFLMIAGTYTPFTLVAIGGAWVSGWAAWSGSSRSAASRSNSWPCRVPATCWSRPISCWAGSSWWRWAPCPPRSRRRG